MAGLLMAVRNGYRPSVAQLARQLAHEVDDLRIDLLSEKIVAYPVVPFAKYGAGSVDKLIEGVLTAVIDSALVDRLDEIDRAMTYSLTHGGLIKYL